MAELPPTSTGAPASPKRRYWWCWVLAMLAVLISSPLMVRYLLVCRAERHLAKVKASLPFTLVPVKDLPSTWGPAPSAADNAAQLVARTCEALDQTLAKKGKSAANQTSSEVKQGELLSKEFERLLVIWGLRGPGMYPDDEASLSPEEARHKAVLDKFYKELFSGRIAHSSPEVEEALAAASKRKRAVKIPPRDIARAREFLADCAEVLAQRDAACRRPAYREAQDGSLEQAMSPSGNIDAVATLIDLTLLESAVEADGGHWDRAYQRICQALRLARFIDQQPTLSNGVSAGRLCRQITAFASKLLDRQGPSAALADDMVRLSEMDGPRRLRALVSSQCIVNNAVIEEVLAGMVMLTRPGPGGNAMSGFLRFYFLDDQAFCLETMGRYWRAAALPRQQALVDIQAVTDDVQEYAESFAGLRGSVSRLSLPVMGMAAEYIYAVDIDGRLFALAVQVSAYRRTNGTYPESLAALSNADTLPRDPYTVTGAGGAGGGQPLRYRRTPEGFIVWSVGPDGNDDGGRTAGELGVPPDKGGDIVVRVPPEPRPGSKPATAGGLP